MQIKEVENLLNINRETVRFYIREGLVNPSQGANHYRDYSDEDVRQLKRILIMRDLDMSIADIRAVFNEDKDFNEVLEGSRRKLNHRQAILENCEWVLGDLRKTGEVRFDPEEYFRRKQEVS